MPEEKDSVDCAITVVVRSRPINERERRATGGMCIQFFEGHTVKLTHPTEQGKVHTFTFDHAYNSTDVTDPTFVKQDRVFQDIGVRVLNSSLDGFNTCIFAYGQTGSGKTYTMLGPGGGREAKQDPGLIPRICSTLFERCEALVEENRHAKLTELDLAPPTLEFKVEVSYLEIYNERVRCLLNPKKENLKVRQHPVTGVFVEDLTRMLCANSEEVFDLMLEGNNARVTAATNMNDRSSRSHALFSLIVTQTRTITTKIGVTSSDRVSRINLVDLAGSERAKATGAEGDRLKEGAGINQSLTTLGLVISGLAELSKQRNGASAGDKKVFIPFRDSTLTWLLKENLGGNSKTFMVSALSPADINYDETLGTLRYADRAKSIVTRACVNEDPNAKMIRDLRSEIEQYKQRLVLAEEEVTRHRKEMEEARFAAREAGRVSALASPPRQSHVDPAAPIPSEPTSDNPVLKRIPLIPKLSLGTKLSKDGQSISPDHSPKPLVGSQYTPDDAITAILTSRSRGRDPSQSVQDEEEDELAMTVRAGGEGAEAVAKALQQRLAITEKLMHDMSQSWEEKKRKTELESEARADSMKELNITVKANKKLPYVMNLSQGEDDDDWIVKYLQVGNTHVGTEERDNGIVLRGDGIAANHFILCYKDEGQGVILHPIPGASTLVDTVEVTEPAYLSSGSVLSVGRKILKFVDPSIPNTARGRTANAINDQAMRAALRNRTIDLMEGREPTKDPPIPCPPPPAFVAVTAPSQGSVAISVNQSQPMIPRLQLGRPHFDTPSDPRPRSPTARSTAAMGASSRTRAMTVVPRPLDENVMVLKYNLVFLGPQGSGKTTLKKTLFTTEGKKWFWESDKLIAVQPTATVEISKETVTVGTDRVELILTDLSGCEELFPTHVFSIPDSRALIVLTFNLTVTMDIPTLKPWIELLQSRCPSSAVFLVGTHKDEFKDVESLSQMLSGAEGAIVDYCGIIEPDESQRVQVLGCAAVSNKDRTVLFPGPGASKTKPYYTIKDLLQLLARYAIDKWRNDSYYPKGFVPARVLTMQRKIAEMRAAGSWTMSGFEFKQTASLIDTRYTYDTEELAQHTHLLHTWRSLIHFRSNALLQRHVFFDAEFVLRLVSHLYAVLHNFTFVAATYPIVLQTRDRDELSKGVLSVANAVTLFRPFLTALNKINKDIKLCLEVLAMFDIAYPISTPVQPVLPTTPPSHRQFSTNQISTNLSRAQSTTKVHVQSAATTEPVVDYFLIPEAFSGSVPNCVPNAYADLMHGLHKKYTFNVLPAGFFSRLLTRLSRSVGRLFQGQMTDMTDCSGDKNTFWKNAAWLQDMKPSRGLLRTDRKSIFISLNAHSTEPLHPTFQLLATVDNCVKIIAEEYQGITMNEFVRCINRDCRNWLLLGKDLHVGGGVAEIVFCPRCKKTFSHSDVVSNRYESKAALRECKRQALMKVASNLAVELSVTARKELRLIADEYYPVSEEKGDDTTGSTSPSEEREISEEEEVRVLDRVLEVMINAPPGDLRGSYYPLSPRLLRSPC